MVALCLTTALGACGGGDGKSAGTTTTAPATSTTLAARVLPRLPAVFVPVGGYAFFELPDSAMATLRDQFASNETVAAADGRSVKRNDVPVAVIIAIGFDARAAAVPGVEQAFVDQATATAVTKRQLTLSGEDAVVGTDAQGTDTIVWLKGALALVIVGRHDDEDTLVELATALVTANA
jgi:hypothetical protein